MLAGAPISVAPPSLPRSRATKGAVCPRCDEPTTLGATLCDACGTTLGEPPRRSGMTQRALALDAEAARLTLEAQSTARPAPTPILARSRTLSVWQRLFVVMTLGLGWLWLRRQPV